MTDELRKSHVLTHISKITRTLLIILNRSRKPQANRECLFINLTWQHLIQIERKFSSDSEDYF